MSVTPNDPGFAPDVIAKSDQLAARLTELVALTRKHYVGGCPNADATPTCVDPAAYLAIEEGSWSDLANLLVIAISRLART